MADMLHLINTFGGVEQIQLRVKDVVIPDL